MAHAPSDPEAVGRNLFARIPVERQRAFGRRVRASFDDMRLVWPALGATVATIACLASGLGFMRLMIREQPASMAALISALADPGCNENPVSLDGRMLLPQQVPAEFMGRPVVDREEALFALQAVVTREGRVQNLELLLQTQPGADRHPGDSSLAGGRCADAVRACTRWRWRAGRGEHGVAARADESPARQWRRPRRR